MYFGGLDVHKEWVTTAVFRHREVGPIRMDRLYNDDKSLRRYFERLAKDAGRRRMKRPKPGRTASRLQPRVCRLRDYSSDRVGGPPRRSDLGR